MYYTRNTRNTFLKIYLQTTSIFEKVLKTCWLFQVSNLFSKLKRKYIIVLDMLYESFLDFI